MWSRSLRNKKKEEGFTGAQQVYDCALDLLSYHDYSHKDMVERLQRKGATKAQALEAVVAYTQTFNKMGFIETEERDEIYMALRGILDALPGDTLLKDALIEKFEELRDF